MAELTLEQIESKLQSRITATHKAAKKYDDGDHWQDGEGFLPFSYMDAVEKAQSKDRLKPSFISENVVSKIIDNEQNGLLGREPDFSVVIDGDYSDTEKERLEAIRKQLNDALVRYVDETQMIKSMRKAFRLSANQETALERGYVPPGYIDGNKNIIKQPDLVSGMKILDFQVLSADKGGVFRDEKFRKPFGVFIKEVEGVKRTEISSVDSEGRTRLRILTERNGQSAARETLPTLLTYIPQDGTEKQDAKAQDLGGQILMFEIDRKPLIDESMISNQKAVNLNHTMKGRGTYQNGHRDAFALNAQAPVEEIKIKNPDGTETIVETPGQVILGGGETNFLNGSPVYKRDASGKLELQGYANASVQIVEPIDPENFIKGEVSEAAAMYRQASQEHLALSDAEVSGKSKEESRQAFEKKLKNLKPLFDALGRWRLTLVMYFGVGNSECGISLEDLKKFRINFDCRVSAGAASVEMIEKAQKDVTEGRLSPETYLSEYQGRDDADAEISRLEESESFKLALSKQRLEVAQLAKTLGLPAEYVVNLLNIEDETQKAALIAVLNANQNNSNNPNDGLPINK